MGEKEMHAETTIITKGSGMPLFLITLEKGNFNNVNKGGVFKHT